MFPSYTHTTKINFHTHPVILIFCSVWAESTKPVYKFTPGEVREERIKEIRTLREKGKKRRNRKKYIDRERELCFPNYPATREESPGLDQRTAHKRERECEESVGVHD